MVREESNLAMNGEGSNPGFRIVSIRSAFVDDQCLGLKYPMNMNKTKWFLFANPPLGSNKDYKHTTWQRREISYRRVRVKRKIQLDGFFKHQLI